MRLNTYFVIGSLLAACAGAHAGPTATFEDRGPGLEALTTYAGLTFNGANATTKAYSLGSQYIVDADGDSIGVGTFYWRKADNSVDLTNTHAFMLNDSSKRFGEAGTSVDIMFAAGFGTSFSVDYAWASTLDGASIALLNADGSVINGFTQNITGPGAVIDKNTGLTCESSWSCVWQTASFSLGDKVAYGVRIVTADEKFFFDNLRFGDASTNVPEPTGAALTLAALGALALTRRRRKS